LQRVEHLFSLKAECKLTAKSGSYGLHISPLREDGFTHASARLTWSVIVDDDLYVRDYTVRLPGGSKAVVKQLAGSNSLVGMRRDVTFEPGAGPIDDRIDAVCVGQGTAAVPTLIQ
jgi:hypothetical protein